MKNKQVLISQVTEEIEWFGGDKIVYAWIEITNPTLVVGDSTQTSEPVIVDNFDDEYISRETIVHDYSDVREGNCIDEITLTELLELLKI